jgi:hypothetical protein
LEHFLGLVNLCNSLESERFASFENLK